MNYYESVVIDYLRADRSIFVNTECCIQVNELSNPDASGPHWYCDAVAVDFGNGSIFLCKISYSAQLDALGKRLEGWNEHWLQIGLALARDSFLRDGWPIRPWLFIPDNSISVLLKKLDQIATKHESLRFIPRVTPLEMVQPWLYSSWNRIGERPKPNTIPNEMQE